MSLPSNYINSSSTPTAPALIGRIRTYTTPSQTHATTIGTTITNNTWISSGNITSLVVDDIASVFPDNYTIPKDFSGRINLQDGAYLEFDCGNYKIVDRDAKITYRGNRIRDFNKFLSGSDLLDEFIRYLATFKMTKREAMNTPIESFIMWLIISAAELDQEETPQQEVLMLTHNVKQRLKPKCKCCGRFIQLKRKEAGIDFCSGEHMEEWLCKTT